MFVQGIQVYSCIVKPSDNRPQYLLTKQIKRRTIKNNKDGCHTKNDIIMKKIISTKIYHYVVWNNTVRIFLFIIFSQFSLLLKKFIGFKYCAS